MPVWMLENWAKKSVSDGLPYQGTPQLAERTTPFAQAIFLHWEVALRDWKTEFPCCGSILFLHDTLVSQIHGVITLSYPVQSQA